MESDGILIMSLSKRIRILAETGIILESVSQGNDIENFPGFSKIEAHNPWFTTKNVQYALHEWSLLLTVDNLTNWISDYKINDDYTNKKKLGIIMAGNIPLVGMHDFICAYIVGVDMRIKLSSKDSVLMKWYIELIKEKDPDFLTKIQVFENNISDFNVVIATGSNNSNRYFNEYFKKYPKILRHNRSSIAVLDGNESNKDLENLADDIFMYFGLGCRNVSHLFVPEGYKFDNLAKAFEKYADIINNNKYANNFNYQYTLIAMNRVLHINMNIALLIKSPSIHSPVSIINYQNYKDKSEVNNIISTNKSNIQCIVSNDSEILNSINFGTTQKPSLSDYADNVDTLKFLLNLH
ncbi:MAG: acyl-CoA reductase [Marinilabiliales bacterium]|nr:MAG: acyl-CoA reductase [Marinilabiliales bacterium]